MLTPPKKSIILCNKHLLNLLDDIESLHAKNLRILKEHKFAIGLYNTET